MKPDEHVASSVRGELPTDAAAGRREGWPALVVSTVARCLLGTLALLLALSVLPGIAGWQTTVVMSGSMEPTLAPGDVALVRPVDPTAVGVGDIVLVDDPDQLGTLRMHRVDEVVEGQLRLRGDASPDVDVSLVDRSAVRGVGSLRLPGLGLPVLWAGEGRITPLLATGGALAALLALAVLHRLPETPVRPPGRRRRPRARRSAVSTRLLRGRARRLTGLTVVALALVAPAAVAGADARFSAVSGNPTSTLSAARYWTCADASQSRQSEALNYYALQEAAGPTAVDTGPAGPVLDATYSATGVTFRAPGPDCGARARSAVALDGISGSMWTAPTASLDKFTVQIWFSTTTTSGGKLIGFGDGTSGAASTRYDRHVYMTDDGRLAFGMQNGKDPSRRNTVTSSSAYNDGRWHLVTASYWSGPGMRLLVDGVEVARDQSFDNPGSYTGSWHVGHDSIGTVWPGAPSSAWFAGSLAHFAVFAFPMGAADAAHQYEAGPWTCPAAAGPSSANAARYWPLQEAGGPTAVNRGAAGAVANGTYSATGVVHGVPGPACGPGANSGVRLDGSAGAISTTQATAAPASFSEQLWFASETTSGGPLIGFDIGGTRADRQVYLTDTGQVAFGVRNGTPITVVSPAAYNDGQWHLASATSSAATGLRLYVDGTLVASRSDVTAAEAATGYWRVGGADLTGWPDAPSSSHFAGSVAHASVYDTVLSDAEVASAHHAGT